MAELRPAQPSQPQERGAAKCESAGARGRTLPEPESESLPEPEPEPEPEPDFLSEPAPEPEPEPEAEPAAAAGAAVPAGRAIMDWPSLISSSTDCRGGEAGRVWKRVDEGMKHESDAVLPRRGRRAATTRVSAEAEGDKRCE